MSRAYMFGEEIVEKMFQNEKQAYGRNLLLNSDFSISDTNGWGRTYYFDIEILNNILQFTCTRVHGSTYIQLPIENLIVNQTYTFTIDAKLYKLIDWKNFEGAKILDTHDTIFESDFKRYSVTFEAIDKDVLIRAYQQNTPVGEKIYIKNYKLERGIKDLPWSPAPEDLINSLKPQTYPLAIM